MGDDSSSLLEPIDGGVRMKFKTQYAQSAYDEMVRELGHIIQSVDAASRRQEDRVPADAASIALSTAYKVAEIRMKGLESALRTGSDIDLQWGAMTAHLMMEAHDG